MRETFPTFPPSVDNFVIFEIFPKIFAMTRLSTLAHLSQRCYQPMALTKVALKTKRMTEFLMVADEIRHIRHEDNGLNKLIRQIKI